MPPPSDLYASIKPIEDRHDIQFSGTMVCVGPCEKCVSGFHITASEHLARCAINLQVDGRLVSCEEIVQSESHLALLGSKLCRAGFPYRTPLQIRAELLRIQAKFERNVTNSPVHRTDDDRGSYILSCHWLVDSDDDDDDFMPSSKERRVESVRKGKEKKAEASSKGISKKAEASSMGKDNKTESSSKGKGGNTVDGAGCIDGR